MGAKLYIRPDRILVEDDEGHARITACEARVLRAIAAGAMPKPVPKRDTHTVWRLRQRLSRTGLEIKSRVGWPGYGYWLNEPLQVIER